MVFEKIFAKLFGKKDENLEPISTEGGETPAVTPVEAEIKSVDEMNVGGLEGVEPATKDLSTEEKEKITSFDEEPVAEVTSEVVTEEPAITSPEEGVHTEEIVSETETTVDSGDTSGE